jgi:phosphohistidine phosphatase
MSKLLYILRHAKAEFATDSDHARQLTPRGLSDATALGEWLRMQSEQPQHVWCSTAARTVSTHGALGLDVPVAFSDGLYLGDERDWLGCIHAVPEEIQRILIIGHNPGMHALAAKLAHSAKSNAEMEQLREGFPTCALAIISFNSSWSEITEDSGQLEHFRRPRDSI